jgi:hypothetical protein
MLLPPRQCWHFSSEADVARVVRGRKARRIRGAPLGRNPEGAPVLFTREAQVKGYRGEGSDAALPLRVLRALRSINRISAVLGPGERIPAPPAGVLEGTQPCEA